MQTQPNAYGNYQLPDAYFNGQIETSLCYHYIWELFSLGKFELCENATASQLTKTLPWSGVSGYVIVKVLDKISIIEGSIDAKLTFLVLTPLLWL